MDRSATTADECAAATAVSSTGQPNSAVHRTRRVELLTRRRGVARCPRLGQAVPARGRGALAGDSVQRVDRQGSAMTKTCFAGARDCMRSESASERATHTDTLSPPANAPAKRPLLLAGDCPSGLTSVAWQIPSARAQGGHIVLCPSGASRLWPMLARRDKEMKPNGRKSDLPADVRRCAVTLWVGAQSVTCCESLTPHPVV